MRPHPLLAFVTLALLAACGADGAPTRPTEPATTGIGLSGDARFGITTK